MKDEVADKCGSAGVYAVVAAAVITDKSTGRFLLCRRPESKADALLWEFPGGKTEKGESTRDALVRECKEELGADVVVEEHVADISGRKQKGSILVSFFFVQADTEAIRALEHKEMRWVTLRQAMSLELCAADKEFLLRAGDIVEKKCRCDM